MKIINGRFILTNPDIEKILGNNPRSLINRDNLKKVDSTNPNISYILGYKDAIKRTIEGIINDDFNMCKLETCTEDEYNNAKSSIISPSTLKERWRNNMLLI